MPIAEALRELGILTVSAKTAVEDAIALPGETLTEEQRRSFRPASLFLPHGVSHDLGIDVHDQSPCAKGIRLDERGRSMMHPLEAGRVLTIEPGVYFIPALLTQEKTRRRFQKTVDFNKVGEFLTFGGIRIEDDAVVTPKNGMEWLTR
jgi:Xaa-Pro aminopeptidase